MSCLLWDFLMSFHGKIKPLRHRHPKRDFLHFTAFFLSGILHRRLDKLPMSMSIMALNPTLPTTWLQTTWTSWGWSSACVPWWWESNGQLGLQSTVPAFLLPTPNSMMILSKSCLVSCCPFRQLLCLTCKIPLLCLYQERVSQSFLLVRINCYFCNQDPAYGVNLAWNVSRSRRCLLAQEDAQSCHIIITKWQNASRSTRFWM